MVNILHSCFTINENWCLCEFSKYIKQGSKVLIIALAFRETQVANLDQWQELYGRNTGKYYDGIVKAFMPYGIDESCFQIINYFQDTSETAKTKIRNADILYFPGGLPDKMYQRIIELDILEYIKNHQGVVMGHSAGAMIQLEEYHISPDKDYPHYCYGKGCGFVYGFGIEVHYDANNEVQNESIRRFIAERKKPVYAIADNGAVIVTDGYIYTVGNVACHAIT